MGLVYGNEADYSKIDLDTVTLEEMEHGCDHWRPPPEGSSFPTRFGMMKQKKYQEILEHIALRDYDGWLVDSLEEHFAAGKKTRKKYAFDNYWDSPRWQALDAYQSGLADKEQWVDYLKFNLKYRPGVLKDKVFPIVETTCCGYRSHITESKLHDQYHFCGYCRGHEVQLRILEYAPYTGELTNEKQTGEPESG